MCTGQYVKCAQLLLLYSCCRSFAHPQKPQVHRFRVCARSELGSRKTVYCMPCHCIMFTASCTGACVNCVELLLLCLCCRSFAYSQGYQDAGPGIMFSADHTQKHHQSIWALCTTVLIFRSFAYPQEHGDASPGVVPSMACRRKTESSNT